MERGGQEAKTEIGGVSGMVAEAYILPLDKVRDRNNQDRWRTGQGGKAECPR